LPIAGDGCGNLYVLALKDPVDGSHPVLFMDVSEDDSRPAYVVASCIWRFVRFLLRREQGFSYWPFEKNRVLEEDPEIEKCSKWARPWEK
jgi:hypothetical protein